MNLCTCTKVVRNILAHSVIQSKSTDFSGLGRYNTAEDCNASGGGGEEREISCNSVTNTWIYSEPSSLPGCRMKGQKRGGGKQTRTEITAFLYTVSMLIFIMI